MLQMILKFSLVFLVVVLLSGCGDVSWFPKGDEITDLDVGTFKYSKADKGGYLTVATHGMFITDAIITEPEGTPVIYEMTADRSVLTLIVGNQRATILSIVSLL